MFSITDTLTKNKRYLPSRLGYHDPFPHVPCKLL